MKKYILDLRVVGLTRLNERHFLLKLTSEAQLPDVIPGQFVEIRIDNSPKTFLRRPISIHFVDPSKNELWLLVQEIGDGTRKLAQLVSGDSLNLVFPLGNGFSLSKTPNKVLLVGGGVGVAPLLYLAAELKHLKCDVSLLMGAKRRSDLLQTDEFSRYANMYFATEDGSCGEKGFVTQHSVLSSARFDFIYTCGPTPMMKEVASYALKNDISCEVSLENKMACGIGACLCCVTPTVEGHRCVCTDGPVFNIKDLLWQN